MPLLRSRKRPMARPRKPRIVDGIQLADHLYPDPKGRPGVYSYLRPDGSHKTFRATTPEAANKIAEEANSMRDQLPQEKNPGSRCRGTFAWHLPEYITYRLTIDPELKNKPSWRNRVYALEGFCNAHPMLMKHYNRKHIADWWNTLTYDQQVLRHAEFRRFFNWLMGINAVILDYNPFTTADDRPRLYIAGKPQKQRQKLTLAEFWAIYDSAGKLGYECLQIAMGISLTTFMRQDDILQLRLKDDLEDDLLKKVISKSLHQRGAVSAARLMWDTGNYELLRQLIRRAREMSLKNSRCPFVISHKPLVRLPSDHKEHPHQVLPRRLQDMFAESREAAGITGGSRKPTTFHEIRNLVSAMAAEAGYSIEEIQAAMAHTDARTTKAYQAAHDLPYTMINIKVTAEMLGGRDFK